MLLSNTEKIEGREIIQTLGLVRGNIVKVKHMGKDIGAALRGIVGGEVKDYTEMLTEAREESMNRMIREAKELDADGVINIRFTTSEVMSSAAEILAYGTAVKLEK